MRVSFITKYSRPLRGRWNATLINICIFVRSNSLTFCGPTISRRRWLESGSCRALPLPLYVPWCISLKSLFINNSKCKHLPFWLWSYLKGCWQAAWNVALRWNVVTLWVISFILDAYVMWPLHSSCDLQTEDSVCCLKTGLDALMFCEFNAATPLHVTFYLVNLKKRNKKQLLH